VPFRHIAPAGLEYALVSVDARGRERRDDPDGLMSAHVIERIMPGAITDIFLLAHGWMGDLDSATQQFDAWIGALEASADRQRAATNFPGFTPLYVGVHWPSLPWGNESLGGSAFSASDESPRTADVDQWLPWFDDTPEIRGAIATILDESNRTGSMSPAARDAFHLLDRSLDDNRGPDADGASLDLNTAAGGDAFGGAGDGLLAPLRLLSYWSMKKRARTIGEGAVHDFIRALQRASRARIHLMGHSFGTIVVSSALRGPAEDSVLERPIDSVALVQGAVSLWSYASAIPDDDSPGYFCDVVKGRKVRGPLIATRSNKDLAVKTLYTLASSMSGDASFGVADVYPRYGAIGRFGLQGLPGDLAVDAPLRPAAAAYGFECGKIYNLEATEFISKMEGVSGAHNDIAGPEVAHAIWEAAFASAREH
jgi:hypothetical protein